MRIALLITFVLPTALAGCGGSPAWAVGRSGATAEAANPSRAALRARVRADVTSGGAEVEPGYPDVGTVSLAESAPMPAAASDGGGFDLDFSSGPPAPSPWDAPAAPSTPSDDGARRLEAAVQGAGAEPVERARYAQNDATPSDAPETATDATSRQLLVYEAHLGLAVHHVVEVQDRVEGLARDRGGFLSSRTDESIVVRVPADAFQGVLEALQELGDVVSRRVQVQDVTEEFHDVRLRIRTLEAMRARVEQLLRDADDVEDALAVQQHLERITVELEQLQGRLRLLSDRVAYSTITVHFAERSAASAPTFRLPFRWLQSLGLDALLSL